MTFHLFTALLERLKINISLETVQSRAMKTKEL